MSAAKSEQSVLLLGNGDVGPIHEPMGPYSELVRETIKTGDIRFAQCERTYSERGYLQVHSNGHNSRQNPRLAEIFTDAGYNVVSLASNHAMDWGREALLDTIELFNSWGIQTIGAGANAEEAHKPAIFEINGVRIGMLGYCSVTRDGYSATEFVAGVAPLRAHTYYEAQEFQPGTPPKITTIPYAEDLAAMQDDIRRTLADVDVVVVSCHMGIHHVPKMLADYQTIIARTAFETGASLVLGHHAHVPKAIEVIDGKVCFHGLGNFMFTTSSRAENKPGHSFGGGQQRYGITMDPDMPTMPFGPDGLRSMIARAEIAKAGPQRVSFLPVLIDKQCRPEILHAGDERFDEAVEYMEWVSSDVKHTFSVDGDEVVVTQ